MPYRWIIPALLLTLSACGRPDFGSTNAGSDVVEVDVEREPAGEDLSNGGNNGSFNGENNNYEGNNATGAPPDRVDNGVDVTPDDFAFAAYASAATHGRNAIVAPHGLARSLVVAYAAADAETAESAATALGPYLGTEVYESFNSADQALSSSEDSTFEMLAAVWLDESVAVESEFAENLARYLGLDLRLVDIASSPEDARNQINNWYGDRTGGRISEVVGARTLDTNSRFVITDATWLSTSWGFGGFDPDRTTYASFAGTESNVQLPMMQGELYVPHFGDETLQTVVLPLANGFSMVAVLPADFEAFEASLDETFLRRMMDDATTQPVQLSLPRIELSDRVMLSSVAEALGGGGLFSADATYSAFADDTRLDDAFLRTRVSFNENGIEINAGAEGDGDGMDPSAPQMREVAFSQPFFFAIYSPTTDQFVTLGRVTQP